MLVLDMFWTISPIRLSRCGSAVVPDATLFTCRRRPRKKRNVSREISQPILFSAAEGKGAVVVKPKPDPHSEEHVEEVADAQANSPYFFEIHHERNMSSYQN